MVINVILRLKIIKNKNIHTVKYHLEKPMSWRKLWCRDDWNKTTKPVDIQSGLTNSVKPGMVKSLDQDSPFSKLLHHPQKSALFLLQASM